MEFYSFNSYNLILPFASLGFALAMFLILLNLSFRVKNHLAGFVRYCMLAVIIFAVRKILFIVGFGINGWWSTALQMFDVSMLLFAFLAIVQLYKMVHFQDSQVLPKKNSR